MKKLSMPFAIIGVVFTVMGTLPFVLVNPLHNNSLSSETAKYLETLIRASYGDQFLYLGLGIGLLLLSYFLKIKN